MYCELTIKIEKPDNVHWKSKCFNMWIKVLAKYFLNDCIFMIDEEISVILKNLFETSGKSSVGTSRVFPPCEFGYASSDSLWPNNCRNNMGKKRASRRCEYACVSSCALWPLSSTGSRGSGEVWQQCWITSLLVFLLLLLLSHTSTDRHPQSPPVEYAYLTYGMSKQIKYIYNK